MNKKRINTLFIAIALTGCASSPENTAQELNHIENKLASYHNGLPVLKASGIKINFRRFAYSPNMLFDKAFGDIRVSGNNIHGYKDMLNLKLWGMLYTKCTTTKPIDITTLEEATKCNITTSKFSYVSLYDIKEAFDNYEENFKSIYFELSKIESMLIKLNKEQVKLWAKSFQDTLKSRYTFSEFPAVLKEFSDAPIQDYLVRVNIENEKVIKHNALIMKQKELEIARKEALRLERIKNENAKNKFLNAQKAQLKEINNLKKRLWGLQESLLKTASNGDPICSYKKNRMGFIEAKSGDNLKVLWKGEVLYHSSGFFFGGMPLKAMSKTKLGEYNFEYKIIDELTWVKKKEVSSCSFDL